MPDGHDPVFQFVTQQQGVRKLGLLFGNELYEVHFDERRLPIGGQVALEVLRAKISMAAAQNGFLLILSESPLRLLLGRDEEGNPRYRPRIHLRGLAARQQAWYGLTRSDLVEAFEIDRRLRIIAHPSDCHRLDACTLPPDGAAPGRGVVAALS